MLAMSRASGRSVGIHERLLQRRFEYFQAKPVRQAPPIKPVERARYVAHTLDQSGA